MMNFFPNVFNISILMFCLDICLVCVWLLYTYCGCGMFVWFVCVCVVVQVCVHICVWCTQMCGVCIDL